MTQQQIEKENRRNEEKLKMEYDLFDRDDIANGFGVRHKISFGEKEYAIPDSGQPSVFDFWRYVFCNLGNYHSEKIRKGREIS